MKTLFILLLGFGGTLPLTCSKKQTNQKTSLYQPNIIINKMQSNKQQSEFITLLSYRLNLEINS
jgi:hypothetical protein